MYLQGGYLGEDVPGNPGVSDIRFRAKAQLAYKRAYQALERMTPAQRQAVFKQAQTVLGRQRTSNQQWIEQTARGMATSDPRSAPGLGSAGAVSTVAQVAGIVATLGSLGLATWNFLEQRKDIKEQKAQEESFYAAQKAALEAEAKQKAELVEAQKQQIQKDIDLLSPGRVEIPADQPKSNTMPLVVGGIAAAALAFLVK